MDIEIQTYWNVETLYYVFNAVASVMAGAGFSGLLKLVFLFAIAIGMFGYMNKQLEMAKWFIHALAFVTVLNLPIARVALTDKTLLEPPRVVDHVPFALAVTAQATNLVFGALTNTYETVFGVPETLGLQKGDIGFGHRILKKVNNATIRDPGLRSDLMQFIKECTIYDIKDGEITPQQIVGETDTWNVIFTHTSPARFVTYNTLASTPITAPCNDVAGILKNRVDLAVTASQTFYGRQVFTRASSDAIAASMFIATVGESYDWILNNTSNASTAMKQAMFNNIWKEAGTELPALLNDPARVAEVNALTSAAQAARQADGSNSTLSLLAQETLPHMRNWIEAILYGLFPIIVVLMIVSSTEGAKKIIMGYLMSLAWIGLWPILFAVINHLSLMHLRHKAQALKLADGVPFQLTDVFDATLIDEQAAIGYMVILVPFIAGAVIKMGQGGFVAIADRMMGGISSAGTAVGASTAGGNINMGQVGVDTVGANTTSMNKYDNNMELLGGNTTIGSRDGSIYTKAASGKISKQAFQNQLLRSRRKDYRQEAGRNQDAHRTDAISAGNQLARRHSDSSSFTDVKGYDATRGQYQNSGVVASSGSEGGYGGQHVTGQNLDRNVREASNFRTAAGANDQLRMNLGFDRGGAGGSGGAPDPREEKRIANAMKQGGASPQQLDQALQNYRGGKGGSGGFNAKAGLGYDGAKTYTAEHGRDRGIDTAHGSQEAARTEYNFAERGSHTTQTGTGDQSAQNNRHGRDAALANVDEVSNVHDVSDRHDHTIGNHAHRSESYGFAAQRDYAADPEFLAEVAEHNKMTPAEFMTLPDQEWERMLDDYLDKKNVIQHSMTMPQQTFAGEKLPTTKGELRQQSAKDRANVQQDIQAIHKRKVAQTGYSGTAPLEVDTSAPSVIANSKGNVQGQLDPKNKESIPARSGALDENVNAWASPDKPVGAGRANPAAVTEDVMFRDGKDTVLKFVDKLTGGDGTEDGEKLNDNMKRETAASVKIKNGGN